MLINKDFIANALNHEAPYLRGHGAEGDYLGAGLLYYALVYMLKAEICVCLGSGGGFVPRIMKQAQRDLQLEGSRTILVDNLSNKWGESIVGDPNSFFRREYPDVEFWQMSTDAAALKLAVQEEIRLDYVHIDADHGPQVEVDFMDYGKMLAPDGAMTFHDTNLKASAVPELMSEISELPEWEIVNLSDLWQGIAIVRRRQ